MSTCVLVVGCYRCGTSAVAGMLHKIGVNMGKKFDPPNANNPRGYWEDIEFKNLHKAFLEGEDYEKLYLEHIQDRKSSHVTWGIKDPRLCMMLPIVTERLDNSDVNHKVIECVRSPWEIAQSLTKSVGSKVNWLPYVRQHVDQKVENLVRYKGQKLALTFDEIFKRIDHAVEPRAVHCAFYRPDHFFKVSARPCRFRGFDHDQAEGDRRLPGVDGAYLRPVSVHPSRALHRRVDGLT